MLSRSALVKLKAILIIDLIVVCGAIGAYLYLQDQGVITGAAKPATFVFNDLVVNPLEAYVGQPIQISVNVTNIGDVEGNATVNLEINGVVVDSVNLTIAGVKSSEIAEFTFIELNSGNYTVAIGELASSFLLKDAPPELSKIVLSDLRADPYEVWPDQPVTLSALATNPSSETDLLMITVCVDDIPVEARLITVDAGDTLQLEFNVTAATEGRHSTKLNALGGSFVVVPEGYHTLTIARSGSGSTSLPFTLNGEKFGTSYTAILPVGQYTITVPNPFDVGTGILGFASWSDGSKSPSITFTLDKRTILVVSYDLLSGYASCPSLYIWNGTGYSYVTDVSNSGWLGYIGHITPEGDIIFSGGNPYDYVKLDKTVLTAKNGYFDLTLTQQWDELFYLDYVNLLVVDHPIGTDVYTSMTNYLNKGSTGQIYTTASGSFLSPVSAVNEQGQDVLEALLWQDGIFAPSINGLESPAWNNQIPNQLTLNLGNLSGAEQIKLVMTCMVDWGQAETYYDWIDQFKEAAAAGLLADNTPITPASKMEILASDGTWINTPQSRQIPLPSDFTARTFTVDLTGLFPPDVTDYVVRFTNFWNVTYDYIAIDTTPQQDLSLINLKPFSAELKQLWETHSVSSGTFTRYGDVTALLQEADDMFVIGRQGDQVNMQFYIDDLSLPAEGMERDYFFVVACWFKDPPGEWGYGYTFTVEPLPFLNMTGFPYTNAENYPYDAIHLTYLNQYNTRIIP
ncbi:MAG: hypothetical protein LBQ98_06140 [Nitrososphaerota archaeon]|jgi:hypothetical protein|nr:hypothetical protein [Nitrososphaerota archaeon]